MYTLENDFLKMSVSPQGAEMQSLYDKTQQKEWLWQGNPTYWGKRAPFLFPFIGAVKNGHYTYQGQTYAMTKHGFARDHAFERVEAGPDQLCFKLVSSPQTLSIYPFPFELRIFYRLKGPQVAVDMEVTNAGPEPMIFSIGGHPAFNCPMDDETWVLEFKGEEKLESLKIELPSGLIQEGRKPVLLEGGTLKLHSGLFDEDALIFEGLQTQAVTLRHGEKPEALTFAYYGLPLLALWSPKAPFLCIEPWVGLADGVGASGALEEKAGCVKLAAGERYHCGYAMGI